MNKDFTKCIKVVLMYRDIYIMLCRVAGGRGNIYENK